MIKTRFLCAGLLLAGVSSMWADQIPYGSPGSIAPTVTLNANGGPIVGYFYGSSAGDFDVVILCDLTHPSCSGPVFPNQFGLTSPGAPHDFGAFPSGDLLAVNLYDVSTLQLFSSDPILSDDGINHAFVTSYSGSGGPAGIPAGLYVGMEDRPLHASDLDYNDGQYVFSGISAVPEPTAVLLLGSILLFLAIVFRKQFARTGR